MAHLQRIDAAPADGAVPEDEQRQLGQEQDLAQQTACAALPRTLLTGSVTGERRAAGEQAAHPAAKRARVDGGQDDATRAAVSLIAEGILTLSKLAAKGSAAVSDIGPQLQEHATALHRLASASKENASS